jgi:hypothetical protein
MPHPHRPPPPPRWRDVGKSFFEKKLKGKDKSGKIFTKRKKEEICTNY